MSNHDARRLACPEDYYNLIRLGAPEVRRDDLVAGGQPALQRSASHLSERFLTQLWNCSAIPRNKLRLTGYCWR